MAKMKPGKRDLNSYTIKGTNKVVRPGDSVLMKPYDSDRLLYVARVEKINVDNKNNVNVRVRWYYRPEEVTGGRRQFHGGKELFLSDHYNTQSAYTIEGKCIVHSFNDYTKLDNVGTEDFFWRFLYKAATGEFNDVPVTVYCKCDMPYNPDDLMVQCERCKNWFHPSCVGMSNDDAEKLDKFLCSVCSSLNSFTVSQAVDSRLADILKNECLFLISNKRFQTKKPLLLCRHGINDQTVYLLKNKQHLNSRSSTKLPSDSEDDTYYSRQRDR